MGGWAARGVILRCVTFNIWKNEGDYPRRMAAIDALLRQHRPDVVALQECFVAPDLGLDSAAFLAGEDYHLTRYPARAKPRWHEGGWVASRSDMAILSRMAPVASGGLALAEDPRDGERGLLWIDLPVAGGVRLGCTHLTHMQDAGAQGVRKAQAAALLDALLAGRETVLLLGDLNATVDAPALAPIFGHPRLIPSEPDRQAIDHILIFATQDAARVNNQCVIAAPDAINHPSDHPAIMAEIEFL